MTLKLDLVGEGSINGSFTTDPCHQTSRQGGALEDHECNDKVVPVRGRTAIAMAVTLMGMTVTLMGGIIHM